MLLSSGYSEAFMTCFGGEGLRKVTVTFLLLLFSQTPSP